MAGSGVLTEASTWPFPRKRSEKRQTETTHQQRVVSSEHAVTKRAFGKWRYRLLPAFALKADISSMFITVLAYQHNVRLAHCSLCFTAIRAI